MEMQGKLIGSSFVIKDGAGKTSLLMVKRRECLIRQYKICNTKLINYDVPFRGLYRNLQSAKFCFEIGYLSLFTKLRKLDESLLSSYSMEEFLFIANFLVRDVLGFGSITNSFSSAPTKLVLPIEAKTLVYEAGVWTVHAFCEQRSSPGRFRYFKPLYIFTEH